jgi:hypothetical protein
MKKKILKTLILGSLLSLSATAFAANPFELVPTSNWTYDAIGNLVQAGIFDGYKDINFNKNQTFTRYELATFVGKALANENKANVEQKATITKLATEFKGELTNLGVYTAATTTPAVASPAVATPASTADNVKFSGFYRLRYHTMRDNTNQANNLHGLYSRIELDSTVKIADEWTGNFAWEAYKDFYSDAGHHSGTYASAWGASGYNGVNDLTIANVTGPIAGTKMTVGKFNNTFGSGLIFDDYVSGVKFEFGNKLKTKLVYAEADSNIEGNTPANSYLSKLNKVTSVDFNYGLSKATSLTASFQNWKSKDSTLDSMNVYDLGITSALDENFSAYGTYDKTSANDNNKAYVIGLSYKGANPDKPHSFGAFLDYENFQQNTAIDTTYWVNPGTKGFAAGFSYVPTKNVKWTNTFVYMKTLDNNNQGKDGTTEISGATLKYFRTQMFFYF